MIGSLLVLFIPLISFLFIVTFRRRVGFENCARFSIGSMFLAAILSIYGLVNYTLAGYAFVYEFGRWISVGTLVVRWSYVYDAPCAVMFVVVTVISLLVHLYSLEYMKGDPKEDLFQAYLSLFTFFMLILVGSGNLLQFFIGWEGVGLCSFILISFWHTRQQAAKSALKAVLMNRFGDIALMFAVCLCAYAYHTVEFSEFYSLALVDRSVDVLGKSCDLSTALGLSLFIAAVGKSAQLGLHTWLPDAMEGPTPVSALIHAAPWLQPVFF